MQDQLHQLEIEFGMPASDILDVINRRNRCKIAVKGAIAEAHLAKQLEKVKADGFIDGFEDFDADGQPDFRVDFRSVPYLVECKNVEKAKSPVSATSRAHSITVDFQRTRNQKGNASARFYGPEEFEVLAACLWNRTGKWEFRFAATKDLPRHPMYPDRLSNRVTVDMEDPLPGIPAIWYNSLSELLSTL